MKLVSVVKMTLCTVLSLIVLVNAQVPQTMSYQGVLTDDQDKPLRNQNVDIRFSIWDAESGGTEGWNETITVITDNNGIFNVIMGLTTPINVDFDQKSWLEIKITTESPFPRIELAPSPYSLNARQSVPRHFN